MDRLPFDREAVDAVAASLTPAECFALLVDDEGGGAADSIYRLLILAHGSM